MASFTTFLKLYKPAANEDGWDDNINSDLDIIDGFVAQFMNVPNFTGAWANAHAYTVGQVALDITTGAFYRAAVAHTSAATGTFAADRTARPTLWTLSNNAAQDSANQAAASATAAATSATAASSSATSSAASFNSFRTVYYGAASADPATDPLGGARNAGDLYYNTAASNLRVFNGTIWTVVPTTGLPEAPVDNLAFGRLNASWVHVVRSDGDGQISNGNFVVSGGVGKGNVGVNNAIPAGMTGHSFGEVSLANVHSIGLYFNAVDGRWHYTRANVAGGWMSTGIPTDGSLPFMSFAMTGETPGVAGSLANPVQVMFVDRQGNFGIGGGIASKAGGGVWSAASDARVKNVVSDYTVGLAEVIEMEPKIFTYKGNDFAIGDGGIKGMPLHQDTTKQYIGVVGQDCEPYMPELVTLTTCYIDDTIETDVREVDSTALIYAMVNAIKTLEARVAALEAP